jgi:ketosteroid isomerase-like protein
MMYINADIYRRAALVVLVGILILGVYMSGGKAADTGSTSPGGEEYQAVEQAINNVLGWAVEKDFDLFFATIADDADFISVTPYDRVKFGVEAVKNDTGFWASPDFKAIRHELRDLNIRFSRSGSVAWFYCEVDDINEWKGKPANWEGARWTGVLEKRDGAWRVVQQHFSFPLK